MVCDGVTIPRDWTLLEPDEYNRAVAHIVRHPDPLACIITPFQLGALHKEAVVLIPAGYLNPVLRRHRILRCDGHAFPSHSLSAVIGPRGKGVLMVKAKDLRLACRISKKICWRKIKQLFRPETSGNTRHAGPLPRNCFNVRNAFQGKGG